MPFSRYSNWVLFTAFSHPFNTRNLRANFFANHKKGAWLKHLLLLLILVQKTVQTVGVIFAVSRSKTEDFRTFLKAQNKGNALCKHKSSITVSNGNFFIIKKRMAITGECPKPKSRCLILIEVRSTVPENNFFNDKLYNMKT